MSDRRFYAVNESIQCARDALDRLSVGNVNFMNSQTKFGDAVEVLKALIVAVEALSEVIKKEV